PENRFQALRHHVDTIRAVHEKERQRKLTGKDLVVEMRSGEVPGMLDAIVHRVEHHTDHLETDWAWTVFKGHARDRSPNRLQFVEAAGELPLASIPQSLVVFSGQPR